MKIFQRGRIVIDRYLGGVFHAEHDGLLLLGGGGFSGLGVRQIDLQSRLALAEVRGDDEKNQQDRENIDQ